MFLLIGNVADEFTQAVSAYGLARRVGVKHITYLSVLQADRFLDVPHFAAKAAVEQTIKNYDLVSRELLSGPGAAAIWSGSLEKRQGTQGTATSTLSKSSCERQATRAGLRMTFGSCSRAMWSAASQCPRRTLLAIAALLGREPRSYRSYAEELAKQWAAAPSV